jgi:O-antigen ligase
MSAHRLGLRPITGADAAVVAGLAAGGLGLGAVYALSAGGVSPMLLPAILVFATAVALAYRRPEIGIAFGLLLVPLSTFGIKPGPLSLSTLLLIWSAYAAAVAYLQRRRLHEPIAVPAVAAIWLVYIGSALLSVTQATDLSAAGHVIARLITSSLLFAATVLAVRDRRTMMWVLGAMTTAGFLVGGHAVFDYLTGASSGAGFITTAGQLIGRETAGFGQPNQLGGFLVVIAPLAAVGTFLARRGRPFFAATTVLAALGVYVSFSRGALIGLAVVPFVFLRGWRLWLIGPLLILVVFLSAPGAITARFATLSSSGSELATRTDIWRAAEAIWVRHPILGVGVGGFPQAYATVPIPDKLYLPATVFVPPPHAHNLFLNVLAEQGVIGLLALLALVVVAGRTALRMRAGPDRETRWLGTALVAALLAFLVHNLFDVTMFDSVTGPYVLVLFGVIAAAGAMTTLATAASDA